MRTILVLIWWSLLFRLVGADDVCPAYDLPPVSNASALLVAQETLVMNIANYALQNYRNSEALAATCDDDVNCSRAVCKPLRRDLAENELTCEALPQNPDCGTNCTKALFSRNRSYLRLAPTLTATKYPQSCDVVSTICAQRNLDSQIFLLTNNRNSFVLEAWVFFGSSNGILRIYPGKELNSSLCNNYDPRKRPWYVGATAVLKSIVVLLDTGPSMGYVLNPATGNEPIFGASRNVIEEFLDTLNPGDEISVFTFGSNASAPTTIVGSTVTVSGKLSIRSSVDDETLDPLREDIMYRIPDPLSSNSIKGNLTAALLTSLDQLSDAAEERLKIILIITAGDLIGEDLPTSLVQDLDTSNTRVFIYRFLGTPVGNSDGNDTVTQTLQNVSCQLRGAYQEALYDAQNPLSTLGSLYSYIAKLRFNLSGQSLPFWVPRYAAASGIGDLITAAYPVFDGDVLVGVAGVDLLIDNYRQTMNVENDLTLRNKLNTLRLQGPPPPIPCTLQQDPAPGFTCPAVLRTSSVTGFCSDVDTSKAPFERFVTRVCCEGCCSGSSNKTDGLSVGAIVGISIGSITATLIIGIGCFLIWCLCCREPGDGDNQGPNNGRRIDDDPGPISESRRNNHYNKPM